MAASPTNLTVALTKSPHAFIQPSLPLYTDTLAYLKHTLDPLATEVSAVQQQRQQEARKKRKRGDAAVNEDILRLKQIHTQGLGVQQVWEQARRVIEATKDEAERALKSATAQDHALTNGHNEEQLYDSSEDEDLGEEGVDYEVEGMDVDGGSDEEGDLEDVDGLEDDFDPEDMDLDPALDDEERGINDEPDEFVADKFGLNDGFFSIDSFNKQSDFLEQQDARGEGDGTASDEEDVDWDANPLSQPDGTNGAPDDEPEADDDEDGPTFGDPDALSEDEDEGMEGGEMDVMGGMGNTNEIMYKDFFAPPAQKKKKNKKGRPNPHNLPENSKDAAEDDDDVERTMAAVHRDLFDDEDSEQDREDEEGETLDPADPKSRRSAHERRKAAFEEEFHKLEAANVGKREWTLSGEARAVDRPTNSLLEQDLNFERAGKPVPVITAEVSESIEELIKHRILAHDFQDITRRRPDDLDAGASRRGRLNFELDDSKSKKGLAEEYEEEHPRNTDPNFVDAKDEKTKKEEKEIEALWKKVCADLDSLSSWHFRPKQAAPQLDIRVDAPAVKMEDARPNAGGDVAGASQLPPQEVYKAGEGTKGSKDEVVGKSGLPVGREELTREEKKRRRRREKERIHKSASNGDSKVQSKGKKERQEVLGDLKRGGVKVIGKKGDVKDVEGNEVREKVGAQHGGGRFKL